MDCKWIPCHFYSKVLFQANILKIQESPPPWTQEAYRPPCSKTLAGGTYLGWGGCLPLGTPILTWPGEGYPPWLGGTYLGVPPVLTWPGVPTLVEGDTYLGVPPARVSTPPSGPGQGRYPLGRVGTSLGVDKLTNWNYYLPPSYGCGR